LPNIFYEKPHTKLKLKKNNNQHLRAYIDYLDDEEYYIISLPFKHLFEMLGFLNIFFQDH